MADSIELVSFGDKELRVVKFSLPDGDASLPVFVIHYRGGKKEFVKICPAVGLHIEQARMLAYHFSAYNQWKREDTFLIERKHLSKLVETVPGITPAYYYRWPGKELASPACEKLRFNGEEIQQIPDEAEDFLEFVHQRRAIDRNVLRLAWSAVAKEAATWMLKKKKPINLGFVKLYAFPLRVNWKEILLCRFPNALWWFRRREDKAEERAKEAEILSELARVEMLAVHGRENHIWWTMEAVPSESWEDDVKDLEMVAMASGNTNYIHRYEKLVTDLFPRILDVFAAYLQKAGRSFGQIVSGLRNGGQKLVPYRGKRDVLPQYGKSIAVRIMEPSSPAQIRDKSQFDTVQPKIVPGVQTLCNFLPATNDVRESIQQGDVDKQANGKTTTPRLPLYDELEIEAGGQSVLPIATEQREDGVDGGADK